MTIDNSSKFYDIFMTDFSYFCRKGHWDTSDTSGSANESGAKNRKCA